MRAFRQTSLTAAVVVVLGLAGCTETGLEPPPAPEPIPAPEYAQLSVGPRHACALDVEGRAFCWGANGSGELGDATTSDSEAAVPVATDVRFAGIEAGRGFSCGLTDTGALWCWGAVPGDGPRLIPIPAGPEGVSFSAVSAGAYFSLCALDADGSAWCGGRFGLGGLAQVPGGPTFSSISAGDSHACAVTPAGDGYCWGLNAYGQLGEHPGRPWWEVGEQPEPAPGGETWSELVAGTSFTCGTTTDGRTMCWGSPERFALHTDTLSDEQYYEGVPQPIAVLAGALSITSLTPASAHYWESSRRAICGLAVLGPVTAVCWGDGQPLTHPGFGAYDFVAVQLGEEFGCGLTGDGAILCWDPIVVTEPLFYGGEQTVSRLVYGDIRPRELPAPVVEWREP